MTIMHDHHAWIAVTRLLTLGPLWDPQSFKFVIKLKFTPFNVSTYTNLHVRIKLLYSFCVLCCHICTSYLFKNIPDTEYFITQEKSFQQTFIVCGDRDRTKLQYGVTWKFLSTLSLGLLNMWCHSFTNTC